MKANALLFNLRELQSEYYILNIPYAGKILYLPLNYHSIAITGK
jgi:hypothetical protein